MAICLKHSQQYNPAIGEWCPYCGKPERFWSDYTTTEKWKENTDYKEQIKIGIVKNVKKK